MRANEKFESIAAIISFVETCPPGNYISHAMIQKGVLDRCGLMPSLYVLRYGIDECIDRHLIKYHKNRIYRLRPNETGEAATTSETSETPETPETPEAPETPETPETPEAPETPAPELRIGKRIRRIELMLESLCGQLGINTPARIEEE